MTSKKVKFAFFGTPIVASQTLDILKENGYIPSLIITSADKPRGRKMKITPSPVKEWAIKNDIPFIQPEDIDEKIITNEQFDLFVVVAYGRILSETILKFPKYGSINIHYSLLPRWRGASPVETAILFGDKKTGVTIQQMEYKMDSGNIIAKSEIKIEDDETAPKLRERLIKIGANLLVETLPKIVEKKISPIKQDETNTTFCKKIKKTDGLINLEDNPTINYNKYRAYKEWPRTFFFRNGKRIIITQAKLIDNKFIIEKIIPENGKEMIYIN
ncbi:MAG: methionyl-tRNA formyltransferase [Candidatus Paceibacterota bacterium]|jgi:methionyl-tRNA formyltransferase